MNRPTARPPWFPNVRHLYLAEPLGGFDVGSYLHQLDDAVDRRNERDRRSARG